MMLPTTSLALQITERKQKTPLTLARIDIPDLGPHEILIENVAVSQAAADTFIVDMDLLRSIPFTNGCDTAGKVVGIGKDVTKFSIGDRVCAVGTCKTSANGTYQQYTISPDHVAAKIPDNYTYEEASTFPIAFGSSATGLFELGIPSSYDAELPLPANSQPPILIWGASSSVGAVAVQIAKVSGHTVVATCSAKNFDYVKCLGADLVVDYKDEEKLREKVKDFTHGGVGLAFLAVSTPETVTAAVKCFSSAGGKLVHNSPFVIEFIKNANFKSDIHFSHGASLDDPKSQSAFNLLSTMLNNKIIVPHPFQVLPGGLAGVNEGWKRARAGEISGFKFVYVIAETPELKQN